MENAKQKRQQHRSIPTPTDLSGESWEFEIWASAVRRQMVAALRRRGGI